MRSLGFLFREFVEGLSHNRFLHFTYGAQVTISLLVLGIFFVLTIGGAVFWARIGAGIEVHVFLANNLDQPHLSQIETDLGNIPHVTGTTYRSAEEALEIFMKRYPNIPMADTVGSNPLPASFIVKVDRPASIQSVAEQCEAIDGVISAHYPSEMLDKYLKILAILVLISLATIALLVIFTYSSINNIIGMSIYARRAEIRIMQLVGATWWFIRWPFIFEGVFFGFTGGFAALVVILVLLVALGETLKVSRLEMALPWIGLSQMHLFVGLGLLLLGLGAIVGFIGSLKAVNNFLRVETDIQLDAQRVRQLTR